MKITQKGRIASEASMFFDKLMYLNFRAKNVVNTYFLMRLFGDF